MRQDYTCRIFIYDAGSVECDPRRLFGSDVEITTLEEIKNLANVANTPTLKHWKSVLMQVVVERLPQSLH